MQMKTASMISAGLHAVALGLMVVSFSGKAMDATPVDSLPVDLISDKEFSQITKGQKDAPKPKEQPKPLVEKIAPQMPVEETKPKVVDNKPEVKATQQKSEPPPPEKKPEEKKDTKAPEKPAAPVADKADPIADKLKEAKNEPKNEPKPLPPKKPPQKQKDFRELAEAALIDQREPQRHASAGDALNKDATLGKTNAAAAQLSQNEIDAFRRRITDCWNLPAGMSGAEDLMVIFRVIFNQDGSIKRGPDMIGGKPSAAGPVFAESAKRALLQCQPYTMLRKETYDNWKDMEIAFKPSDMFR